MARQIVYPHEEILARDINNFINSMETTFFNSFIANALPNLPSFIGTSLLCEINGDDMVIKKGIGFMEKLPAPTDGSTPTALIKLNEDKTVTVSDLAIALPTTGNTKQVSVGVRWILRNKPAEDRTYTTATGNVDRSTITMNEWDSQFSYATGTLASTGYVKIAEITLNENGIQSIVDSRNYFNMFDPDLFTLFGRKNLTLSLMYDGINLIELPFEFSSAVSKLDQISLREVKRGHYDEPGARVITHSTSNFAVSAPVAQTLNQNAVFGTSSVGAWEQRNASWLGSYGFSGAPSARLLANFDNYEIGTSYINASNAPKISNVYWRNAASESSVRRWLTALRTLLANGFFVSFFPNTGNKLTDVVINKIALFRIPFSRLNIRYDAVAGGLISFQSDATAPLSSSRSISPLFTGSQFDFPLANNQKKCWIMFTTVSPITGGKTTYDYDSSTPVAIPTLVKLSLLDFQYNRSSKLLTFKLQTTDSSFPRTPQFSTVKVKKGNILRGNIITYENLNESISGRVATYTYTYSTENDIIRDTDTSFSDFKMEFDVGTQVRLATYETEIKAKNTHYDILETTNRVFLNIKPSAVTQGNEIIISHIIPPALLDQAEGSTVGSNLATDVSSLQTAVRLLQQQQATNTGKIASLEARGSVDTSTTLLWGYGALRARASDNANQANSDANTAFATPANRNEQAIDNLAEGGLIGYAAPAPAGYYHPWIAIEISKLNTLRIENDIGDETDLWSIATSSITVNNKAYRLYARSLPLQQTETLTIVVQSYN